MGWRERKHQETYSSTEIEERLNEVIPQWYLENSWVRRKYKTSGLKYTLMAANTTGRLAEPAFNHPDLRVSYASVVMKLIHTQPSASQTKTLNWQNNQGNRYAQT